MLSFFVRSVQRVPSPPFDVRLVDHLTRFCYCSLKPQLPHQQYTLTI